MIFLRVEEHQLKNMDAKEENSGKMRLNSTQSDSSFVFQQSFGIRADAIHNSEGWTVRHVASFPASCSMKINVEAFTLQGSLKTNSMSMMMHFMSCMYNIVVTDENMRWMRRIG